MITKEEICNNLAACAVGQKVRVTALRPSPVSARLLELGIYAGRELEIIYTAPFGDPLAVQVGTYVLSMRRDEARLIEIEPITAGLAHA